MRYILRKHSFFLMGILLLIVSLVLFISSVSATIRCTEETTGTVIDYELSIDDEGDASYFPVASFTANGLAYEVTASSGSNRQPYAVGEDVTILYNPEDPCDFIFQGDHTKRNIGIYLFFVALFIMAVDILSALGVFPLGDRRA